MNNALDSVLVTFAFSAWTTPVTPENIHAGWHNVGTGIHFHKVPRSTSHPGAGDPMKLFLRYGLVGHPRVGEYEF